MTEANTILMRWRKTPQSEWNAEPKRQCRQCKSELWQRKIAREAVANPTCEPASIP